MYFPHQQSTWQDLLTASMIGRWVSKHQTHYLWSLYSLLTAVDRLRPQMNSSRDSTKARLSVFWWDWCRPVVSSVPEAAMSALLAHLHANGAALSNWQQHWSLSSLMYSTGEKIPCNSKLGPDKIVVSCHWSNNIQNMITMWQRGWWTWFIHGFNN